MADEIASFSLSYDGGLAEGHELDFYDISQALIGFERSLALTTHLVLNVVIFTQAPYLQGARITARPPNEGSWEIFAAVYLLGKAIYKIGTTPRDTPAGHLVSSIYDYVVSHTVGVHVDYSKTLGAQIEEADNSQQKRIPQYKMDSLAEKCEGAIAQIHRPIVKTKTAKYAKLIAHTSAGVKQIGPTLDQGTYDYIAHTIPSEKPSQIVGRVSSYNRNSFKGRIFDLAEGRPIPFELSSDSRDTESTGAIAESLRLNVISQGRLGDLACEAIRLTSRTGLLKRYIITQVWHQADDSDSDF
jgi:hypothetical protein